MLKNSVRNSRPNRSLAANLVLLNKAKSKLLIPCARRRGSTRGSLPKLKSAGAAKQAVLNQRGAFTLFGSPSLEVELPDTDPLQPGKKLGGAPPPKSVVPFTCPLLKISGKPR